MKATLTIYGEPEVPNDVAAAAGGHYAVVRIDEVEVHRPDGSSIRGRPLMVEPLTAAVATAIDAPKGEGVAARVWMLEER